MKRFDFNGDGKFERFKLNLSLEPIIKKLQEEKEKALVEILEIVVGHIPTRAEVKKWGEIHRFENKPDEEVIVWKGKPIAILRWKIENGKIHFTKEWNIPT